MAGSGSIQLRGVAVHNLRQVDLDLPLHRWIVFCGLSGSGKSSLAFDTLYAEGQRRYLESFSAYTRQFLERLEKPAAERISGIPPAIAVTAQAGGRSSRATVGSATEISDYLRLLLAKLGRVVCPGCGQEIRRRFPIDVAQALCQLPTGTRLIVAFPQAATGGESLVARRAALREAGFVRAVLDGRMCRLDQPEPEAPVEDAKELHGVVDRLAAQSTPDSRLVDSLETAFRHGEGVCVVWHEPVAGLPRPIETIDGQSWQRGTFANQWRCFPCERDFLAPEPRLFSQNSPLGACPKCQGLGVVARTYLPCDACGGARLRPEALAVRLAGRNFAELHALQASELRAFLASAPFDAHESRVAATLLAQLGGRLRFLVEVGLEYLALDRPLRTLSSGEVQRVALTSALGSSLVNVLYVLDEPSVGLHPRDTDRLVGCIGGLRDRGNTVVVVDHDEALLRAADELVEIGPGAGQQGGTVIFQGPPAAIVDAPTLTGDYLAGRRKIRAATRRRPPDRGWIRLAGARGHNLQNLTVEFPLGLLCVVTGVSGAGKSTLIDQTLYPALVRRLRKDKAATENDDAPLPHDDLFGDGQIDEVVLVDQSPIGRSPRSNPVTYLKVFDEIRQVFADTMTAHTRNYTASHFSFNVAGGRCNACEGDGYVKIDMQFLADVFMKCSQCDGTRYRGEILDVEYRGRNIADVLEMTVREAFTFFRGHPKVQARLKQLIDVGLDYVRLGQPANTLSGGEAQRLKLASYVAGTRRGRSLFILDEPTTGLHFADVVVLLDCFEALLNVGHSLIVVEHNLSLIKCADYLIDLGPGAAAEGGRVVAKGTPEQVARVPESITGRYLAKALAEDRADAEALDAGS